MILYYATFFSLIVNIKALEIRKTDRKTQATKFYLKIFLQSCFIEGTFFTHTHKYTSTYRIIHARLSIQIPHVWIFVQAANGNGISHGEIRGSKVCRATRDVSIRLIFSGNSEASC